MLCGSQGGRVLLERRHRVSDLQLYSGKAVPVFVGVLDQELAALEQELLVEVADILYAQLDSLFPGEPPGLLEDCL